MSSPKSKIIKSLFLLVTLPLSLLAVKQVVDWRKGAAGTPADITIDISSPQGNLNPSLWRNLAQGGEEPVDMIGPVLPLVRQLQPELIRVDHLFDYYQVYQGPNNYDFSQLDKVVNSILLSGATPLLSLSYTTADMSKTGQNAGEPKDWNLWFQLVSATAKRYSVDKNIPNIYYEVWNEPDLFGGWHYNRSPSYSTLYLQTARAIAQGAGNSVYKIGGPAITGFYPNWITSLLKFAANNNLRLDFLSWHRYSKNIDDFLTDFDKLNLILTDYPQYGNIERFITEIGPNSEPDPWYDNHLSGIHLISLTSQLAGKVHRIFPFEAVDGPSPRSDKNTGWGIITHPSSKANPKPRFAAIQLLNNLSGQRLATTGEGSWVTSLSTQDGSVTRILLVNYDPRNAHAETVPLTIAGITPGRYQLASTSYPSSQPPSKTTITVSTFRYSTKIYLDVNSAVLLELSPV
jgi:hypothetical protein